MERNAHIMLRIARVLRNSFSVTKNINSLVTPPAKNKLKSLQGVRALNMIALLLCHMFMAKMFLPYLNKTEMSEVSVNIFSFMFLPECFTNKIFCRICQNHG